MNPDKDISLKHRLFNVVFLVGMFMSFSCSLMNYFLGAATAAILLSFFCGVITVVFYIVFKKTRNYELISLLVVILLSFVFFPTMWIATGGTGNSITYYIIINAAIIAVLLIGLKRRIILLLFALIVGALMVVEYRMPDIRTDHSSELARYIDLSFGLFVSMFSISVLIAVLIDSYMSELEKSKKLSITDYLTGAYNKGFITSCLNEEIKASQRTKKKLTVAMIDIDDFKFINDTYGHIYGDYVLKRIVSTIKSNLRQNDIVGRFGGDEFFIILRDTGKEEGYAMMELIRQKIQEIDWERDLIVTISGGVVELESDDLTDLLKKVDHLLYKAKHKNKNLIEAEASG